MLGDTFIPARNMSLHTIDDKGYDWPTYFEIYFETGETIVVTSWNNKSVQVESFHEATATDFYINEFATWELFLEYYNGLTGRVGALV